MRLLDRYLLRELLVPLAYCLAGFVVFWISFDLLSELDEYQKQRLSVGQILLLYEAKTPMLLVQAMPIALLLGLLYALTHHARHHELIAMRAAGVSLARLSVPYFAVGLTFALAVFALNEFVVPAGDLVADRLLQGANKNSATRNGDWHEGRIDFGTVSGGRIWNIGDYNLETSEMKDVQVSWKSPDGWEHSLKAASAIRTNEVWTFFEVEKEVYLPEKFQESQPEPMRTNVLAAIDFHETPEQIRSEIRVASILRTSSAKSAQLSIREITEYLRFHPQLSSAAASVLHTQLQARWAWPWTCLVVVAIALPFGASSGRRNVFAGVATSIFIAFGFFVLLRLGFALGAGERLPAWLAAWLPHLVFGTGGLVLSARAR